MTGRVLSLHLWPVKSMAGEPRAELALDDRGAIGDRVWAVRDAASGALLTARQAPRLLAWAAGEDHVTAPSGERFAPADPALPGALADHLGRTVTVDHDPVGQQDLGHTVLVTFEATRRVLRPGWDDLRRFRTNIHVEADAPAWVEEGWEGRRLRVGEVELQLLHPCERCVIPTRDPDTQVKDGELMRWLFREQSGLFGINARVLGAGVVRTADPVELLSPG